MPSSVRCNKVSFFWKHIVAVVELSILHVGIWTLAEGAVHCTCVFQSLCWSVGVSVTFNLQDLMYKS